MLRMDKTSRIAPLGHSGDRPASPDRATVADLRPGQRGRVVAVDGRGAIRQRLLDMGILPGALIVVARVAPAGDPIWIEIEGNHISLRRSEAAAVAVADW